jgi:DNA-binding NarL/FixJ family response regulator
VGKKAAHRPPFIAALWQAITITEGRLSQLEQRPVILIVEDHEVMRRTLVEYVQSAYPDIAIMEAADGARALQLCRSSSPRLVLMDVALPDANGIELTAQIREMLPETEVVIVSQHADAAYIERARAAGAFAYITKDKVYRELLSTIDRALGRAPPDREHGNTQ